MGLENTYSRELLDSASVLHQVRPETQATLRRAISTPYYALFHLLIQETCKNWARPEQRADLARMFEHRTMLGASNRQVDKYNRALPGSQEFELKAVAFAFSQLQGRRHNADYDVSKTFSSRDVAVDIDLAERAFRSWEAVQSEQIAQDYLFSLLFRSRF